jgi:hypothetical protein
MPKKSKDLQHVGVLGMHWGIRRNKVDTTAPEHKRAKVLKKKKLKDLSNEEIKALVTRLQLEKQFKELTAKQTGPGEKFVKGVLSSIAKQLLSTFLNKYASQGFDNFVNAARERTGNSSARETVVNLLEGG